MPNDSTWVDLTSQPDRSADDKEPSTVKTIELTYSVMKPEPSRSYILQDIEPTNPSPIQRLKWLEKSLGGALQQNVRYGSELKEIRDSKLYLADGFESWDSYLKKRVWGVFGIERRQAYNLISIATIAPKLPDLVQENAQDEKLEWKPSVVKEFERLAPQDTTKHGSPRDVQAISKQDLKRVAEAAVEIAKERSKPVTASIVREAVDADLGINTKHPEPALKPEFGIDLHMFLYQKNEQFEAVYEMLDAVSKDGWQQLEESHPDLNSRLAKTCERIALILRRPYQ